MKRWGTRSGRHRGNRWGDSTPHSGRRSGWPLLHAHAHADAYAHTFEPRTDEQKSQTSHTQKPFEKNATMRIKKALRQDKLRVLVFLPSPDRLAACPADVLCCCCCCDCDWCNCSFRSCAVVYVHNSRSFAFSRSLPWSAPSSSVLSLVSSRLSTSQLCNMTPRFVNSCPNVRWQVN
jgi:hypothetical protein